MQWNNRRVILVSLLMATTNTTTNSSFEATILPLRDVLYARALGLTKSPAAADDLTQDVLIRAYRHWQTFTPGTSARAWLFTILRNTFYSQCKAHNRRSQIHDDAAAECDGPCPTSPDRFVAAQRVREAIAQLPEVYRAAVTLSDLEGYTYQEAAEAMGCPIGSIMSRVHRGRRKLAAILGE